MKTVLFIYFLQIRYNVDPQECHLFTNKDNCALVTYGLM